MTESKDVVVIRATENFTRIVSTKEIKEVYPELYWGGNGVGDRFANKHFNYSAISKKGSSLYSENEDDTIPSDILNEFLQTNKGSGIIGIWVHSKRTNIPLRPIRSDIGKQIKKSSCVVCGTDKTVCDHKNDLYNDERVLNEKTQLMSDFQPLCNHCNLQKRQICIEEKKEKKLYSAKKIKMYESYPFEFPWEKKAYDELDINCKYGTFWFDPVQFNKNINDYSRLVPIINEIKYRVKVGKLKVNESNR
jgi:hypothetical protein